MSPSPDSHPPTTAPGRRPDGEDAGPPLKWTDGEGRRWQIALSAESITLRSGEEVVVLPAAVILLDLHFKLIWTIGWSVFFVALAVAGLFATISAARSLRR